MPDQHLADIEEQRVKHDPPDARNDELTAGQVGWARRKGGGRFMRPSYAAQCGEFEGPYQSVCPKTGRRKLTLAVL